MRPPFNSFQSQARPPPPQRQQHQHQQNNGYSSHHQHNGYHQNPVNSSNQLGMMNPQMMSHMNNPIPMPNMPIHPQFFNNMPQQQQQQLNQFALNQLLPNLLGNLQFAVANNNIMGQSLPFVQPNLFQPSLQPSAFTSQPHHNSFSYPPVPPPLQNQQLRPPPPPQGQGVGSVNNANCSGSKGNDFRNKFTKHQNFKGPGQGFQRPHLHQGNNGKRKSEFNKDHMGKGNKDKKATRVDGSDAGNIAKEKKSSYGWFYTPKEVEEWREARRKCFPTKRNVQKKLKKKDSRCILDEETKLRRQQLREVIAKQHEVCPDDVAKVPKHYLSNIDEQVNGDGGDNNGQLENEQEGSVQNKRRRGEKNRRNKKPRFQVKEPTLVEKLSSADIKRDKTQLLQVFRFMVINSFFKEESPEQQPLKLPLVMVEETGCEHATEDPTVELLNDGLFDDNDDDDDVDVNGDEDNLCDEAVEK